MPNVQLLRNFLDKELSGLTYSLLITCSGTFFYHTADSNERISDCRNKALPKLWIALEDLLDSLASSTKQMNFIENGQKVIILTDRLFQPFAIETVLECDHFCESLAHQCTAHFQSLIEDAFHKSCADFEVCSSELIEMDFENFVHYFTSITIN